MFLLFRVRLRHERDLIVNMKYEEERLSKEMEQEENNMKKLVEVLDIIERLVKQVWCVVPWPDRLVRLPGQ